MTAPTEPPAWSPRRIRWWLAAAVVVVAAVAVTLVLTTGHAGGGDDTADAADGTSAADPAAPASTPTGGAGPGLSTPEAAAESFAAAAATGDGGELLSLTCVGHLSCADEHDVDAARLADARAVITENVHELAIHLDGAEFGPAVDGAVPGSVDVPYRTPAMADGATLTLTFVRSGDRWLYLGPAT